MLVERNVLDAKPRDPNLRNKDSRLQSRKQSQVRLDYPLAVPERFHQLPISTQPRPQSTRPKQAARSSRIKPTHLKFNSFILSFARCPASEAYKNQPPRVQPSRSARHTYLAQRQMYTLRAQLLLEPLYSRYRPPFSDLEWFHAPHVLDGLFQGFEIWRLERSKPPRGSVCHGNLDGFSPTVLLATVPQSSP
jgi:hypothetical protein